MYCRDRAGLANCGTELPSCDLWGTLYDGRRGMRIPAYFAPDAADSARYAENPIYIRRGTVDYISRKRNTWGIEREFKTGKRIVLTGLLISSSKSGGIFVPPLALYAKGPIILKLGIIKLYFKDFYTCRKSLFCWNLQWIFIWVLFVVKIIFYFCLTAFAVDI